MANIIEIAFWLILLYVGLSIFGEGLLDLKQADSVFGFLGALVILWIGYRIIVRVL